MKVEYKFITNLLLHSGWDSNKYNENTYVLRIPPLSPDESSKEGAGSVCEAWGIISTSVRHLGLCHFPSQARPAPSHVLLPVLTHRFSQKWQLKQHQKTHTNKRKASSSMTPTKRKKNGEFYCRDCMQSFATRQELFCIKLATWKTRELTYQCNLTSTLRMNEWILCCEKMLTLSSAIIISPRWVLIIIFP